MVTRHTRSTAMRTLRGTITETANSFVESRLLAGLTDGEGEGEGEGEGTVGLSR